MLKGKEHSAVEFGFELLKQLTGLDLLSVKHAAQPVSNASKKTKVKLMVDADSLKAVEDLMGGMKKDKRLAGNARKLLDAVEAMGIGATAGATI